MVYIKNQKAWNKGIPMSEEQKLKISSSKKGKKIAKRVFKSLSENHKKNISRRLIGIKRPYKKRGPMSDETKRKISESHKGKIVSQETKDKIRKVNVGKKLSKESCEKMRQRQLNISLEYRIKVRNGIKKAMLEGRHSGYKGGITKINETIRKSLEYRLWREEVFKRDSWTCVICKKRGVKLNADHIKPFSLFKELRFEINNGRTLCIPCHKNTDTFGSKINKKYVISK
jgi:hypothetical protein